MGKKLLVGAGALATLIFVVAAMDGGKEPLRTIEQDVTLPEAENET